MKPIKIYGLFTGTTCRARCRDGSLSVAVSACFFSCFSDAGSIAKFRGSWLAIRGSLIKVRVRKQPDFFHRTYGALRINRETIKRYNALVRDPSQQIMKLRH